MIKDGIVFMLFRINLILQIALDSKKRVFTWGFGGYGRLGHNEPKDEMVPRKLGYFDGPNRGCTQIQAGSTFSLGVSEHGIKSVSF
jgi:alpha-tubulin suppressor-like RCC1 family protein